MTEPDEKPAVRRNYVAAKNRREAVQKMIMNHPTLKAMYRAGPNDDGKGGWINAIKEQRGSVYRLLFYLDRLPLAAEYQDREPYELLYGDIHDDDVPNYPRALFTTTGGVNLMRDGLPGITFAREIQTNSLEIVPLPFDRDLLTAGLRDRGYAYICCYDGEGQGLRIFDLSDFYEIYVNREKQEIQVRNEDTVVVGDAQLVKPFLLKYVVKRAEHQAIDPSDAASRLLD